MKLKDIIKESTLGDLPSDKLFKFNKATGRYDKPLSENIPAEKLNINGQIIGAIIGVETTLKDLAKSNSAASLARVNMKGAEYIAALKQFQRSHVQS